MLTYAISSVTAMKQKDIVLPPYRDVQKWRGFLLHACLRGYLFLPNPILIPDRPLGLHRLPQYYSLRCTP